MNVIEKLLALQLADDLTETTWWTDMVFRGLEQAGTDDQGVNAGHAAAPQDMTGQQ